MFLRSGKKLFKKWPKKYMESQKLLSTTSKKYRAEEELPNNVEQDDSIVIVEKDETFKIMSIGINRPKKRNCVNFETADKLFDAFNDFEMDDNMNCAVLHGIGGNFSAGYDSVSYTHLTLPTTPYV